MKEFHKVVWVGYGAVADHNTCRPNRNRAAERARGTHILVRRAAHTVEQRTLKMVVAQAGEFVSCAARVRARARVCVCVRVCVRLSLSLSLCLCVRTRGPNECLVCGSRRGEAERQRGI